MRIRVAWVAFISVFLCALAGQAQAAIYWGDGTPVGRANLDGTYQAFEFIPFAPSAPAGTPSAETSTTDCGGVAVDAGHIYWANPATGTIGRASLDGTAPDNSFITGAANPCGVAVDAAHVYWANYAANTIGRANLDGSEPTQTFVSAVSNPCGVAVDKKFLYWSSASAHYIGRALLTGDKGPTFIELGSDATPCGIALDESHIYWTSFEGEIGRANLDGSNPDSSFITGLENPCGLAVDGNRVYWSEQWYPAHIGAAMLDGTGVNRGILTGLRLGACGLAVDGTSFAPPPHVLPSQFSFGKVKHNRGKGIAFVPVDFPDAGFLRVVASAGVKWSGLPVDKTGSSLASGGQQWLKVWAGGKGGNGRRLRQTLKRRGRAQVGIEIHYTANGQSPSVKGKQLSLIWE